MRRANRTNLVINYFKITNTFSRVLLYRRVFLNAVDNLKLKATTGSELDMISALLQDGIVLKNTIEFDAESKLFFFLVDRFCWETVADKNENKNYRIHSGVYFHGVSNVKHNKEFTEHKTSKLLSLMTIHSNFVDEINIIFSNNAIISLTTNEINVYLKDLFEPWPAGRIPRHNV